MATHAATISTTALHAPARVGIVLPSISLWWREIVRFYRQRSRVIGVIASPLLFWVVIGSGLRTSVLSPGRRRPALSRLLLPWRAHHDRALHRHLHHDVGHRRPQRRLPSFRIGRTRQPL